MHNGELAYMTVAELGDRFRKEELSPVEVTEACLARIEAHDDRLNAFLTVTEEAARQAAREAEKELRQGNDRGPFHGIPVAFKDLIEIEGVPMTAGSRILEHNVSKVTATVVEKLRKAGAVILGKTNLQEFARGPTGVDSHFGAASNPWDVTRIAGGSSSGSGAAVAGRMAAAALGSDTGGSVRIPAALCGIVGIRPTYGRVSRYGAVPLGRSYDVLGPMTRSVEDAALMLAAIAGHDPRDPSTRNVPLGDYADSLRQGRNEGLKGICLGVPGNYFFPGLDAEAEALVRTAIALLEGLGADVREVDIPYTEYGAATYLAVNGPDYGLYHLPSLVARRSEYCRLTAESFELGLFVPGWRHLQGQAARRLFLRQTAEVFRQVDAVVTPTVPVTAPPIDACDDWRALLHATVAFSSVGTPALSVPCGFTKAGLPVGLQLVGKWWEEETLFRIGAIYEAATDWHIRRPAFESALVPNHAPPPQEFKASEETEEAMVGRKTVGEWAKILGLPVAEDALDALTMRVDRMLRSLRRLDDLPLDDIEPGAYFAVPDPGENPA
jgi:aspartyl-tRNA(Asn)/glutamyl-tRNA(Gln) amidotransferase subunit A